MKPIFSMFWRIERRLLTANYGRLFVILLALGAGSAVTSALLNLQIDARQRLSTEFRALGANVIIAPPQPSAASSSPTTLQEGILANLPAEYEGKPVLAVGFLYVIGQAAKSDDHHFAPAVLAGTKGNALTQIRPGRRTEYQANLENASDACEVGEKAAQQFHLHAGDAVQLRNQDKTAACKVFAVVSTGGAEDSQIFTNLETVQSLTGLRNRLSLVQLSVNGNPDGVKSFISSLAQRLPEISVSGIKQFAEGETRIYNRIIGVLTATTVLVLLLTSLCVMAGMTNVAAERKNDVGLMKAIGGSVRRVVRLFLTEAILLGIAGGLVGSAVGMAVSIWLGQAVFGVAAQPRWIVYPVSVTLTVLVSIVSAFPLRHLAHIRPASVFRGAQ